MLLAPYVNPMSPPTSWSVLWPHPLPQALSFDRCHRRLLGFPSEHTSSYVEPTCLTVHLPFKSEPPPPPVATPISRLLVPHRSRTYDPKGRGDQGGLRRNTDRLTTTTAIDPTYSRPVCYTSTTTTYNTTSLKLQVFSLCCRHHRLPEPLSAPPLVLDLTFTRIDDLRPRGRGNQGGPSVDRLRFRTERPWTGTE